MLMCVAQQERSPLGNVVSILNQTTRQKRLGDKPTHGPARVLIAVR